MKKIFAMLLVVIMTISCFSGCKTENVKKPELGESLDQLTSLFEDAKAVEEELTFNISVTLNQPLLSDENLSALMGEDGAMALPVLKPFIKDDTTLEIPVSMRVASKINGNGTLNFKLGSGADALAFSGIFADGDMFINVKEIYAWVAVLMGTITGETAPAWPLENEYVSLMDVVALVQGFSAGEDAGALEGELYAASLTATSDSSAASGDSFDAIYDSSYENPLEGLMGAGVSPEMLTAIGEALLEAIPEDSILEFVDIVETALQNAGMLSEKNGYMTFTLNGDNLKKFPDALANAADGKLGKIIDDVVNGIKNSDNSIISSMIPEGEEIKGSEIEDLLIAELKDMKNDLNDVAEEMKNMNASMEIGFKVTDKGIECKALSQATIEEDGLSATIKVSMTATLEAIKDVNVQAPNNVMTETELSEFVQGFMG